MAAVLIASNFSNTTGYAWKFIYRIQSVVARRMVECSLDVVLSFATIDGPIATLEADIPFRAFEWDPTNVTPRSARALFRDIRRHQIRYAYLTDMPPYHWVYAVMRLAGVKRIVSHSHVSVASPHPAPRERGLRGLLKATIARTPFAVDATYAVSQFVAQRLADQARYPTARTTVILNGIDVDRFAPLPEQPSRSGPLRVFLGCRAIEVKGVHVLIEAARLLRSRSDLPPYSIRYAGDGPDLEKFRSLAAQYQLGDAFHFLGALPNTLDELRAADVVVVPSIWGDACPLSAIEALAAGKAVVASRAGGLPEIVGGPDTGLLVPPADPRSLADALAVLLVDGAKRHAMGEAARRRAEQCFAEAAFHRTVADRVASDFRVIQCGNRGTE